jgi:23S rRNA (cytosine1962-C5)-methyltransferase
MEALSDVIVTALQEMGAKTVVVRGEGAARALEGLEDSVRCAFGQIDGPVPVEENGVTFFADLMSGQKTGWFFDQRDNHAFMGSLSKGARVLDLYTHTGGFALPAAKAGATEVLGVDRSAPAL